MDIFILVMFVAFLFVLIAALFSISHEEFNEKDLSTLTGRPPTCKYHQWEYNQYNRMYCERCGHLPGENQ